MGFHVKPFGWMDLLTFTRLVPQRDAAVEAAPDEALPSLEAYPANALAQAVHPAAQHLKVAKVEDISATVRRFTLVPDRERGTHALAPFRAGQYLSLRLSIDGSKTNRAYSLCSAPQAAVADNGAAGGSANGTANNPAGGPADGQPFYQIAVKREDNGFVSKHVFDTFFVGTAVDASAPAGHLCPSSIRDERHIVCVAGGIGITPFLSLAHAVAGGIEEFQLTIVCSNRTCSDALFHDELEHLAGCSNGRVRIVHTLTREEKEGFRSGRVSAAMLSEVCDLAGSSFFICGPNAMGSALEADLLAAGVPRRRVRRETFTTVARGNEEPRTHLLTVRVKHDVRTMPCREDESLLVAVERDGIAFDALCRSGSCGCCRARLIAGEVHIEAAQEADGDGRRAADQAQGRVHLCCTYPRSDAEIDLTQR